MTPPHTRSRAAPAKGSETLATYFRRVGRRRRLTPEQEIELAREIETSEVREWEEILICVPAAKRVRPLLEEHLERRVPELDRLLAARGASSRRRAAQDVARMIRAADLDRVCLDRVQREVRRLRGPDVRFHLERIDRARKEAERSRHRFIEANLRLVVSMAMQYRNRGVPLADLIQEGNLGLMKAVRRFDHRRGMRFSTYAVWWIRHALGRALAQNARLVRLPAYVIDGLQNISRAEARFSAEYGRSATLEEIAEMTGLQPAQIETLRGVGGEGRPIALDDPENDAVERPGADLLRERLAAHEELSERILALASGQKLIELLERLPDGEADVLRKRFSIQTDHEWTLQEIADRYGVTRERIRQIQEKALTSMRRMMTRHERLH